MSKFNLIILTFFVLISSINSQQVPKPSNMYTNMDSVNRKVDLIDSRVIILENSAKTDHNLIDILEKTNNQLNLWISPLTLMVSILAILFVLLSVVAGFILFRQSAEYKRTIKKSIDYFTDVINKLINDANKQIKETVEGVDENIANKLDKLDKLEQDLSARQQKDIKLELEKLLKQRKDLVEKIKEPYLIFPKNLSKQSTQVEPDIDVLFKDFVKRQHSIPVNKVDEETRIRLKKYFDNIEQDKLKQK